MTYPNFVPGLASLLGAATPVPAAFNPLALLAPVMTPLGVMLAPMAAPMSAPANPFNPGLFNPAMLPTFPGFMPGMTPFTGLPAPMHNPFAALPQFPSLPQFPFSAPQAPATFPAFPAFPAFPLPFPGGR